MDFIFYELEFNINKVKDGEYIDLSKKVLDTKNNYIFTFGSIPIGIYIPYYFENDFFNKDIFNLLNKDLTIRNNRGNISGKIDINKLSNCYKKYINNNTKFNKTGCRVKKDDFIKYEFCNDYKCAIINNTRKHYLKDKTLYEKTLKPLVNKINKTLYKFFDVKEKDNLFQYFTEAIINKNTRAAIHKDNRNKTELSAIIQLTENKNLISSNLNLPDYNISIELISNKSLLIFDLKNTRHSNDPINELLLKDRISVVFYNK